MNLFSKAALAVTFALAATAAGADTLKFGVLSDVDSLPYLVAQDRGFLAGQDIVLVPFQSPVERDAAFQAGAVDGVIGDVLGAALAVQGGFDTAIAASTDGRYQLLGAPGTKLTPATLKDLAGQAVAGSRNTVIHYFVGRTLAQAGVAADQVNLLAIPKMPLRLEALVNGQVAAASLPDPLATVARTRGAVVLAESPALKDFDPGVVLFNRAALKAKASQVAALLDAGARAGALVNADPASFKPFLASALKFPPEALDQFVFVTYRPRRLPSEASVAAALGWMKDQGLLKADLKAADLLARP